MLCIFLSVDRWHSGFLQEHLGVDQNTLCGWITLTPFCQLHLRPTVLPPPLSAWLSFSLLTRNGPKPDKLPINIYPCLHLIWKLECLLLMLMVNDLQGIMVMRSPVGRKKALFLYVWTCFSPGSQILSLALAPLNPPVPLLVAFSGAECSWECFWIIILLILPVCKLPKISSISALHGVACFVFHSQSSFPVQRVLFNMPAVQHTPFLTPFSSLSWYKTRKDMMPYYVFIVLLFKEALPITILQMVPLLGVS